jgi:hypothetical protein
MKHPIFSFYLLVFSYISISAQVNIHIESPASETLPTPVITYSFENEPLADDSGAYPATLAGAAEIKTMDDGNRVFFSGAPGNPGYLDLSTAMGKTVLADLNGDFSISIDLMNGEPNTLSNYCWAYSFSNSTTRYIGLINAAGNGNWYYEIKNTATENVKSGSGLSVNQWHNLTYTQQGTTGKIYLDGFLRATTTVNAHPADIAASLTTAALAKSPFTADAYMQNTYFDNFQLFDQALTAEQVQALYETMQSLSNAEPQQPIVEDDNEAVAADLDEICLDEVCYFMETIPLPASGRNGSVITWTSSNPEYITDGGQVLQIPAHNAGNLSVTLTALAQRGTATQTRDFPVCIHEDEGYSAYLFAYFTGNSQAQEQLRFAISYDGYNYVPLNNGERVVNLDGIARWNAIRDPHILRGHAGDNHFYIVATDMKSSAGWSSNDGIVMLKSTDLINWSAVAVDFPTIFPNLYTRESLTRVWAPQTIYDESAGKYMVYYSLEYTGRVLTIFYSYANDDFTTLTTEPQILVDYGESIIDADIVKWRNTYQMVLAGIWKVSAPALSGPWSPLDTSNKLQKTTNAAEGPALFKLNNSNDWILMYDVYGNGYYQFCKTSDMNTFTLVAQTATSGNFTPRHGTVIGITQEEADRLLQHWEPTGIEKVLLQNQWDDNAPVFDILGRYAGKAGDISKLTRGIYITNNQKIRVTNKH